MSSGLLNRSWPTRGCSIPFVNTGNPAEPLVYKIVFATIEIYGRTHLKGNTKKARVGTPGVFPGNARPTP